MGKKENKETLIIQMYNQLFNDINRHITVIWQSISVLIGAFAIFTLVEKKIVSIDIACSIIILISSWLFAHLFDAAYWYNRNLVIIANIEKHFLNKDDLNKIHYYFGKHREKNKMIKHLRIQFAFGIGLLIIVLYYHFFEQILPLLKLKYYDPILIKLLPYFVLILAIVYLIKLKINRDTAYKEILKNSPGIPIDSSNIVYGRGHGKIFKFFNNNK